MTSYYLTQRLGPKRYRLLAATHPPVALGVYAFDGDRWSCQVEHPALPAIEQMFDWSGSAAVALKQAAIAAGLTVERSS